MNTPTIPLTSLHRAHMECRSDVCKQNSARCPCPEACQVSEPEPMTREALRFWAIYLAAVGAAFFFTFF